MSLGRPVSIVSFAGSIRRGSYNEAVLRLAESMAADAGGEVRPLRLDDYPMPLYNADFHREEGIPTETHDLFARIVDADAVLIASPEYNGGYTPLLKNTIDWLSRIDKFVLFPRLVGVIAVTPGARAGANVLAQTTAQLESMSVRVHEPFGLGHCRERVIDGVLVDEEGVERLRGWVHGYVAAAASQAADPPRPPS